MGTRDMCRVSPAAVRNGRARQIYGVGPCGDCRMILSRGNRARGVSIRGKFVSSTKLGYKTMGYHHVAT